MIAQQKDPAGDPTARPVVALVVNGDVTLASDVILHPPAGLAELALLMNRVLLGAIDAAQFSPEVVEVRHKELVRELRPLLAKRGIRVARKKRLRFLERAADAIAWENVPSPPDFTPRLRGPRTWAGWQLPHDQITRFFSAAALFYRAAPWRVTKNIHVLSATIPGGGGWTLGVMGYNGMEFGLVIYEKRNDLLSVFENVDPFETMANFDGAVLALSFEPRGDLPRPMQQEIMGARWEVAGPMAYPYVVPYNTVADGITGAMLEELIALLPAVARFVDKHERALSGATRARLPVLWTDKQSGIRVAFEGILKDNAEQGSHVQELTPCCSLVAGEPALAIFAPDAEPEDILAKALESVTRFEAWLTAVSNPGRLAASTAHKHARFAESFMTFLSLTQKTPVITVNEYDLRIFLYDWFPRNAPMSETSAASALNSLRLFFAFLAEEMNTECPWADALLSDRGTYRERWRSLPDGSFWSEAVQKWQASVYHDLDARVMVHDMGEGGGIKWGASMGVMEGRFDHLLQRLWLKWRDEIIRTGVRDPERVRAALLPMQHEFEHTVPPGLSESPAMIIEREQARRSRRN